MIAPILRNTITGVHRSVGIQLYSFQLKLIFTSCSPWLPMFRKLFPWISWKISLMSKFTTSFNTNSWIIRHSSLILCRTRIVLNIWSLIMKRSWYSSQWRSWIVELILSHWRIVHWRYFPCLFSFILFTILFSLFVNVFRNELFDVIEERMFNDLSSCYSSDRI